MMMLPYGRQLIDEIDVSAVADVLRSDWLTTGPKVEEFENAVADYCGVRAGVAVSSGTAALHAAMFAVGVEPGDEVIVPAMTFVATANSVVFQGGTPVFADVDPTTLLVDPTSVASLISPKTKAIVAVDYAGQPCDYAALTKIAAQAKVPLIADACHAIGAQCHGIKTGGLADLTVFSFHPVKHITTGEGGMIVTNDSRFATRMKRFRNHGIATDARQREQQGTFYYEMTELGYNYRVSDFQCALGLSQLKKLPTWLERRRELAMRYDAHFRGSFDVAPLAAMPDVKNAYHLYVVRLLLANRLRTYSLLREAGIGVNVHYLPVHLHPFYQERFKTSRGLCPNAEAAYEQILSLPMHPGMTDNDLARVVSALDGALERGKSERPGPSDTLQAARAAR